jgi:hypothetical protein
MCTLYGDALIKISSQEPAGLELQINIRGRPTDSDFIVQITLLPFSKDQKVSTLSFCRALVCRPRNLWQINNGSSSVKMMSIKL